IEVNFTSYRERCNIPILSDQNIIQASRLPTPTLIGCYLLKSF
ncbi:MAG: hypothetical protein RIQ60_3416, partial [Pseudomonadota bacterium]